MAVPVVINLTVAVAKWCLPRYRGCCYGDRMPVEDQLQRARDTAAYKAAVWIFRLNLLVTAVLLVLRFTGLVTSYPGPVAVLSPIVWIGAVVCGYVLLHRVGVRVIGMSDDAWDSRGMVYRDVFWLGKRTR